MRLVKQAVLRFLICALLLLAAPRWVRAIDWQPVAPEDLAMKDNPKQPGSDAMILYLEFIDDASKAGSSGDSIEEYIRIKIFTQEGTKYGHVEIPFKKNYQNVSLVTGRTIKPDGTIVKFDGQVLETTVEKLSGVKVLVKSFSLPDVQPGSIVEYKYQMQGQPGWVHSQEWIVSQDIYTREARFTYLPDDAYGNNLHPMCSTYLLPADTTLKQLPNGTYVMSVHDIAGIVEEPLMPPEKPIQTRVEFYYADSDAPPATDPNDRYWGHYIKKWDAELEHFTDKKNALNQELSKIVSPTDMPDAKLRKIYARVQQVRNLDTEDYKVAKEAKAENLKENTNVEDVLKHGYAHSTQINYLFVGLARAAGFDATELYIAPRNAAIFIPTRNEVRQLSDEIVWVHAGTQDYFLDPAARYFPFGLLPWYETATGGFRIDKRGGTQVATPEPVPSDSKTIRNVDLEVKDDGSVEGVIQVDFTGQGAALLREEKRKEDETGRTKDFESDVKSWLPVGAVFKIVKVANWDDNDKPIHIEGTLTMPSFATSAPQRMLMPLEMFQSTQQSAFASEKRVNVVYFRYPYEEIDDIKLHLPTTFKVETAPAARTVDLGAVSYQISAAASGNSVEVKRHLTEKGTFFTKEEYPALRKFFGVVKTGDSAQMVIRNAQSAKAN